MTATELVAQVRNLPPVSQAALRLVAMLDAPAVSNEEVVAALKCDNVLTAKLLRACNSSFFSPAEPVLSVDQAVLLLGHQQILHIVLTLAFGGAMTGPLQGYSVEAGELWQHSLIAATAGEILANEISELNVEPSVAFTIGLLHDIGKLVLNQVLTSDVQATLRRRIASGRISRTEAELQFLGTDHAEVGACLLRTWKLPEVIIEAVANHHHPVLTPRPEFSAVAHLANSVAHLAGSAPGWEGLAVRVEPAVIDCFSLTPERLEGLVGQVGQALEKVDQFMAVG